MRSHRKYMNKKTLLILFFAFFQNFILYSQLKNDTNWENQAQIFIKKFYDKDFEYCYSQFDESVKKSFSLDLFKQAYSQLEFGSGPMVSIGKTKLVEQKGYFITGTEVKHKKNELIIEITYGKNGKIFGFFFKPPKSKSNDNYKAPTYVKKSNFQSDSITFGEKYKLDGILTYPKTGNTFPLIILVHGSGPNDLDETIGPNKPFKDIAEGLSSNGIAVFRYNKRTLKYGEELSKYDSLTLEDETIQDAIFAFNKLSNHQKIDKSQIYILGHSLGGFAIPQIAKSTSTAAGYIILAGSNQPLEQKILEQYEYISNLKNNQGITKEILAVIKQQVERVSKNNFDLNTPKDSLPFGASPLYWKYLNDYKPLEEIKKIQNKILVLQGERDYQVTVAEFNNWKSALSNNTKASFILYPELNHLFMEGEGKGKATPEEYSKPSNVSEKVINDILQWVKSN